MNQKLQDQKVKVSVGGANFSSISQASRVTGVSRKRIQEQISGKKEAKEGKAIWVKLI